MYYYIIYSHNLAWSPVLESAMPPKLESNSVKIVTARSCRYCQLQRSFSSVRKPTISGNVFIWLCNHVGRGYFSMQQQILPPSPLPSEAIFPCPLHAFSHPEKPCLLTTLTSGLTFVGSVVQRLSIDCCWYSAGAHSFTKSSLGTCIVAPGFPHGPQGIMWSEAEPSSRMEVVMRARWL